jgi:hypothetical protein
LQDFVGQRSRSVPFYIKLGAKLAAGLGRRHIQRLAESEGGPLYWLAHDDQARIKAYFGSKEAWLKLPPDWDSVEFNQPSRVPRRLAHGYDESKPMTSWAADDLQQAAAFRGGTYRNQHASDPYELAVWTCALGHEFQMSPNLMLKGGHWCPTCMTDSSSYDEVALRSPYFVQVWRDGH